MRRVLSVLVLIVLTTPLLRAQTTTGGSINGVARDQQGAVVPGVAVTATSETAPGVYRATTDRAGQYRLNDLPPGEYSITAAVDRFATFVREPIVVRAGLSVLVDLEMKVGAMTLLAGIPPRRRLSVNGATKLGSRKDSYPR